MSLCSSGGLSVSQALCSPGVHLSKSVQLSLGICASMRLSLSRPVHTSVCPPACVRPAVRPLVCPWLSLCPSSPRNWHPRRPPKALTGAAGLPASPDTGSRGHENPRDQDRGSPSLLPCSHLPVQSPRPEVLAPDTSCSKEALAEGKTDAVSKNPSHRAPVWGEREPRSAGRSGTPPPASVPPVPGAWAEEDTGAVGRPPAVGVLTANAVPRAYKGPAGPSATAPRAVAPTRPRTAVAEAGHSPFYGWEN